MLRAKSSLNSLLKPIALGALCIASIGLASGIFASSVSTSCADAYGEYFLEGDQVFGRTSEAYFPVKITQTVLISRETEKCTTAEGNVFQVFSEQSVIRVKGKPTDDAPEITISFLCEENGDSFRHSNDVDEVCVKTESIRQGPFTEQ